ncbi:hypothetical protein A2870_01115 [Candidatus Curtissbacteria bacterium RIFCSPHIGHO2_01_FULL_41_11]|uniref:Uncharacterized protein n=1 Tax=Candidatus Curtissbacteria bacterium RIFCSPHIGHO2_01_FULL_41_11 TaxID=1797711 RepID=A0A1F5G8C5_9BACT|nr:MAG: hypothetical protein A2870_01115 [Candidatus Curtissbacteria bacterium RIFCSPHIGHO2_01_FULL_41_11]
MTAGKLSYEPGTKEELYNFKPYNRSMSEQNEAQNGTAENPANPNRLGENQNFLEQPPLNRIIRNVSQKTGLSPQIVRRLLGYLARKEGMGTPAKEATANLQDPASINLQAFVRLNKLSKSWAAVRASAKELGTALGNVPFWNEYISSQMEVTKYSHSGERIDTKRVSATEIFPELYIKWVAEKLQRQGKLVTEGINEIFQQDTKGRHVSIVPRKFHRKT